MNAEAITAKILEEAKTGASEILRDAGEKAARIREDAEKKADQRRSEAAALSKKQAADLRERMLRMAELDQRKALLSVKRELIDAAFADALARMRNMPADQKRAFLKGLLLSASGVGETLIPDDNERALYDEAFMNSLNAALEKAGKPPVTLSPDGRKLGGGFILKSGGLEINCTYESVLAQARPGMEAEVAQRLFGQRGD